MLRTQKGNKFVELLGTNNKKLADQWKMHSGVLKVYDSQAKTFIYDVGGKSPVAKLSLPKDRKQNLEFPYPLLMIQLYLPVKFNILLDIGITTITCQRKRITLSSIQRNQQLTPLSVILPLAISLSETWLNILIDMENILPAFWKNSKFREMNSITISGVFRLKRIILLSRDLTVKRKEVYAVKYEELPKQIQFPKQMLQFFTYVSGSCEMFDSFKEMYSVNSELTQSKSEQNSHILTSLPRRKYLLKVETKSRQPTQLQDFNSPIIKMLKSQLSAHSLMENEQKKLQNKYLQIVLPSVSHVGFKTTKS